MDYKILLGYLAVAIAILAYALYIRSILRGRTKPHAFSWLLWALLTGVVFAAQYVRGGGAGAWVTGVSSVVCLIIGLLALARDDRGFSRFDWFFLSAGLLALAIWFLDQDPVYAVILVTLVDVLGYASTIRKGYYYPHEEKAFSFALNSLKFVVAIFALQSYSLTTWLYPAALIVMNGSVALLVLVRRQFKARPITA